MPIMNVLYMVNEGEKLFQNQLLIPIWGGQSTPVDVVDDAALPFMNYFTVFLL